MPGASTASSSSPARICLSNGLWWTGPTWRGADAAELLVAAKKPATSTRARRAARREVDDRVTDDPFEGRVGGFSLDRRERREKTQSQRFSWSRVRRPRKPDQRAGRRGRRTPAA